MGRIIYWRLQNTFLKFDHFYSSISMQYEEAIQIKFSISITSMYL